MDKQQEIKTLQSLKGDTYFNQFFSNEDIDTMCENIRNDFAIEGGTKFNQRATELQYGLARINREAVEQEQETVALTIKSLYGDIPSELYNHFVERVGRMFIIKFKWENKIDLSTDEVQYLIDTHK